ncbi:hypothetical protein FB192DRAFT_1405045 [Mucor lusitanicus]|uniref:Chromo domain-containing protein n=1 Tax=Mucor circinelloides f. lusitanicus TaxID=29924 RepID=A0A8H4B751_MUCCL|nr:hypothetical protein FB192DRAFT_1405045 [Mucor lusitanicus]
MPRGRGRIPKNEEQVEEAGPESAAEEEYEVERVESHQITGKGKRAKLVYLVKWKNYPDSDNTWEPASAVENAKQLVDEYWATQGGEKEREQVIKQLHDGYKTTAATKEKKGKKEAAAAAPALAAEKEEPATESRKRKTGRGAAASSSPAATPATATNSRKKRAKLDAPAAEDAKPKETAYESEDEDDVSDSEVEGENFRINMKWDGRIHKVQYVRRDEDDNELYAIVRWTDSKVAKYKTSIVARKAPLKLIEFYEDRLSFQED